MGYMSDWQKAYGELKLALPNRALLARETGIGTDTLKAIDEGRRKPSEKQKQVLQATLDRYRRRAHLGETGIIAARQVCEAILARDTVAGCHHEAQRCLEQIDDELLPTFLTDIER